MNDSTHKRTHGRMPSDAQMDGLLRDFFRLESPTELNRPFQREIAAASSGLAVTVVQGASESTTHIRKNQRFAVVSSLVVLALSLVVVIQARNSEPSGDGPKTTTVDGQKSSASSEASLMLVSPEGDSRAHKAAVGDDGVTLEETDNIDVKRRR